MSQPLIPASILSPCSSMDQVHRLHAREINNLNLTLQHARPPNPSPSPSPPQSCASLPPLLLLPTTPIQIQPLWYLPHSPPQHQHHLLPLLPLSRVHMQSLLTPCLRTVKAPPRCQTL